MNSEAGIKAMKYVGNSIVIESKSETMFKLADRETSVISDDDFNTPITFTNEDGQTILVTLTDSIISDQEVSITDTPSTSQSPPNESHDQSAAVLDMLVTTVNEADSTTTESPYNSLKQSVQITQNWITSKSDKRVLQDQGHRWKQGQWTSEENEILRNNISSYCKDKGIADPNSIIFDMTKDMRKDFYRVVARGLDRPLFSVYRRVIRMYDQKNHIGKYTPEEIIRLKELREIHGNDWATIGATLGRSAGSVRDRCRLMKDSCRYGTWQHEEEMRLAAAVYELSGVQPGEEVHHGLCWAHVAAKVKTRTEKQCRAKWLNFLNWKQKGGAEWAGAADDNILLEKIIASGVCDESELDWVKLSKGWSCVRSPQWLRSKWWALKRRVPNYQTLPFSDILANLTTLAQSGAQKPRNYSGEISHLNLSSDDSRAGSSSISKLLPLRLCNGETFRLAPTVQLPDGSHAVISDDLSVDSNPLSFITSSANTFLIANSSDSLSLPLSTLTEPLIVQALPLSEIDSTEKSGASILTDSHHTEDISSQPDEIVLLEDVSNMAAGASSAVGGTSGSPPVLVSDQVSNLLVTSDASSNETLIPLSSLTDPLLNGQPGDINTDN